MREYLRYRMSVNKITNDDLRKLLEVSEKTIRNKISGSSDFTWREAVKIKTTYFPNEQYETLFENIV